MDYKKIYADFIADRQRAKPAGYSEKHHIVPRSLGGDNSKGNLVQLSARDHYFAHCCLAKIHGGEMWAALHLMAHTQKTNHGARPFSFGRMFAISRERSAAQRSETVSIGWLLGDVKGRKHYGPVSEETRAKQSAAQKGRKMSPEAIAKRVAAQQLGAPRFEFTHPASGRAFTGSALEFRRAHGIGQAHVSLLTRGKVEVAKGWVLRGNEEKQRGNRDPTIRIFRHRDGRVFEGTAYDFNAQHIHDSGMLSNCINGKNGVKTARGWTHEGEK